ncbi:MAG: hypothetical protein KF770_26185 [Anaerolineae bacterium]|nr:hypothetical protein [Anaerolineae bacterium]
MGQPFRQGSGQSGNGLAAAGAEHGQPYHFFVGGGNDGVCVRVGLHYLAHEDAENGTRLVGWGVRPYNSCMCDERP